MGAESLDCYCAHRLHAPSGRPAPVGMLARLDHVARAAVLGDFKVGRFEVPGDVALLPLDDGVHCAVIDASDLATASQHTWRATRYHRDLFGYVTKRPGAIGLHRWLLDAAPGTVYDHKNRLLLDNRRCNVRRATMQQNTWNAARFKDDGNSSLLFGVTRVDDGWLAAIGHRGARLSIGIFEDEIDAGKAFDAKCLELRGEFAVLNFPEVR